MQPSTSCLRCEYKSSCGMCRLNPLMHGYTEAFGYSDCQEFMRDISLFYEEDARQ